MQLSETWEQLVTAALLGTERTGPVPALESPLVELTGAVAARSRESNLLGSAAIVDLYRRAGTAASPATMEVPGAPPDTMRTISRKSAYQLGQLLEEYPHLLAEFLLACVQIGNRVAESQLPSLLNLAATPSGEHLRKTVTQVLGERGKWLAQQNPAWRALFDTPDAGDFETGSRAQRLRYFRHLRDSDPAAARALLEKNWSQEAPEDRAGFIATLAHRLSMDDEPFLEAALDDKRKEVRDAAADLLARLPESRLAGRMLVRLAPLVIQKKKLLGKTTLEFSLPPDHSKDMQRDGIPATSTVKGLGDKAFHLSLIIAGTPLSFWTHSLKLDAPALAAIVVKSEWSMAIYRGLAEAAIRQADAPMAGSVIANWAARFSSDDIGANRELVERLIGSLPNREREDALAPLFADKSGKVDPDLLLMMAGACDHPWSLDFSKKFLPFFFHLLGGERSRYLVDRALAETLGNRIHPDLAATIAEKLRDGSLQSTNLDRFIALLQFRHDMLMELRK